MKSRWWLFSQLKVDLDDTTKQPAGSADLPASSLILPAPVVAADRPGVVRFPSGCHPFPVEGVGNHKLVVGGIVPRRPGLRQLSTF